jgi:hypothetical protein
VLNLSPSALKARFNIKFKQAKDDELGNFCWCVLQTASGRQFGLRQFEMERSSGTEVLVDETSVNLSGKLNEFEQALNFSRSDFVWINPEAH